MADSETHIFKKRFFKQELKKLKKYQTILKDVDGVFTISPFEQEYFQKKIGPHCHYVPAFHHAFQKKHRKKNGSFVLYHGNVLVSENVKAALFLIDIYKDSEFELVIASSYENEALMEEVSQHKNIILKKINTEKDLETLFNNAHINVLPTFQKTGIKLKLLNTLYQGKFVIANNYMVEDTGLENLCEIANSKEEFITITRELLKKDFTDDIVAKRIKTLAPFNPKKGAQKIIDIIFS
ncbi:MAG: glycosyltransferase [Flavobacteriaceae bacterium]